jgi:NADH-quinone oxidoreductase subunit C
LTDLLSLDFVKTTLEGLGTVEQVRSNRIQVAIDTERLRLVIQKAQENLRCDRLITISTVDTGSAFELFYHLTGPHRTIISIRVVLPRDRPVLATVSDLLPPAGIYERQIHDLMGIMFQGNPNLKRIILNEDWPENEFPMRKDWKPDPNTFYGGIVKEDNPCPK